MTHHGPQASGTRVLDFGPSNVVDDGVGVAKKLVPAGTVLRWDGAFPAPCNAREVVIFLSFLVVGLAPAFSPFFVALLEEFALHLVHLTPNTVLMLALFVHACEMFVGVRPTVEPFRHFYAPVRSGSISPAPTPPRSTAPSGGTSGRAGSNSGCTSRLTTCPSVSIFPRGRRRSTPSGPTNQRWAQHGSRCWSGSTRSDRWASP